MNDYKTALEMAQTEAISNAKNMDDLFAEGAAWDAKFILNHDAVKGLVNYVERVHSYSGGDCYCEEDEVLKCEGCFTRELLKAFTAFRESVIGGKDE